MSSEKTMITMPSTTSTAPVARLRVFGVALLANRAAILAHMKVNSTQSPNISQSGVPPMVKWEIAPVSAVKVMIKTLVPTAVFNS